MPKNDSSATLKSGFHYYISGLNSHNLVAKGKICCWRSRKVGNEDFPLFGYVAAQYHVAQKKRSHLHM